MRAEANQGRFLAEALPAELTDVQLLSDHAHLGVAGVPDMRVVGPDHGLGSGAPRLEQVLESFEHVGVAQIPGLRAAIIHDAVVALSRGDQACVLRSVFYSNAAPPGEV